MKKHILLCGLAALTATAVLFAANDKLVFFKDKTKVRTVRVDEISGISYTGQDAGGFSKMHIAFGDADPLEIDIDEFSRIEYVEGLPDNPLHVTVEPHHTCATLHITSDDPGAYYRVSGFPAYDLRNIPEEEWTDYIFNDDVAFCQNVAISSGKQLCDFAMSDIFHSGDLDRDFWPSSILLPDEECVLLFYTGEVEGNDIHMTTEPLLVKFRTKKAEFENTEYDLDVDFISNTFTVKANAVESEDSDPDIPFYIEVYNKSDVEATGLETLVASDMAALENIIYRTGSSWGEAMFRTTGERTYTNTRVGDQKVAVAFGCEYGVITTPFFTKEFTVPVPAKTSDATFELNIDPVSTSEYSLDVTPSDADIRWAGMLVESSKIPDDYTRAATVSSTICFLNQTSPSWKDRYVHSGAVSGVSTQSGLVSGNYMSVGTEYSILIFGVDDNGCVITDILEHKVTPQSSAANLSIGITFSDFRQNGNVNYLTANLVPSDKEAKYVFDCLPDDNACVQLDCTDEEFIDRYVAVSGEYLDMHVYTGDQAKIMSMSNKFDSTLGMWKFGYYIAFAFGYDGEATSGLYVYKINAATGETELLRSPAESLSLDVEIKDFTEVSASENHITASVRPSDPDAKYVMDILPASNTLMMLDLTDEEFVQEYTAVQGQWLSRFTYTGDQEKVFSMGKEWNTALGMYMYGKYYIFMFGYDGEQTSPLQMFEVDAATGTYTQVRGAVEPE